MKLVCLCIIFCVAMVVAPSLVDNQGYVFISLGNYTVELSVIAAIGIIILTFLLFLLLCQLIKWFFSCKNVFRLFFARRREATARENLYLGVLALLEQRYSEAHKLLIQNTHSKHRSVASYIIAAQAAIQTKSEKDCIKALDKALKIEPRARLACILLHSDLYVALNDYEKAAEIIEQVSTEYQNNAVIFRKLANIYVKLNDYKRLREIIPNIKSCKAFSFDDFMKLQVSVYENELRNITDQNELCGVWSQVSRNLKKQSQILGLFARKFAELGDVSSSEKIFLEGLRKLDENTVCLEIVKCNVFMPKILEKLEDLSVDPKKDNNPIFIRALANQYYARKDYKLALEYLRKVVAIDGISDDFIKIASCYESGSLCDKSNLSLSKSSV